MNFTIPKRPEPPSVAGVTGVGYGRKATSTFSAAGAEIASAAPYCLRPVPPTVGPIRRSTAPTDTVPPSKNEVPLAPQGATFRGRRLVPSSLPTTARPRSPQSALEMPTLAPAEVETPIDPDLLQAFGHLSIHDLYPEMIDLDNRPLVVDASDLDLNLTDCRLQLRQLRSQLRDVLNPAPPGTRLPMWPSQVPRLDAPDDGVAGGARVAYYRMRVNQLEQCAHLLVVGCVAFVRFLMTMP